MATYVVMAPPEVTAEKLTEANAQRITFVKDGFSWGALLIPIIWLLYNRMWLAFLGYLVAVAAIQIAADSVGGAAPGVFAIGFALLFAIEGSALRVWSLERKNWQTLGIISARNRDEAEVRFFDFWLNDVGAPVNSTPSPAHGATAPRFSEHSVVGLTLND
ncbi:DUF2628 domain-containing protein [Pseudovibrio sp. SPO723]|uniref:DUF2628 domain-containing protein n=1 Tax=Nesiotobacter zosterae TaxID=392721 RepID=UPI0029C248EA|nr:DUF2628 domain-containing protein [Pseudovibrio sp. SPO723]MDX5592060.1 DUF2628 domain-containing protein [Pseudovibrio sp. SPO723]